MIIADRKDAPARLVPAESCEGFKYLTDGDDPLDWLERIASDVEDVRLAIQELRPMSETEAAD